MAMVSTFLTHDSGRPLTAGIIADRRHTSTPDPMDIHSLAQLARPDADACAYGKLVMLDRFGIWTFQATSGGTAARVFCGNSTAAAIASLGGSGIVRTKVHGAAALPCDVAAQIDGAAVSQTWHVPATTPEERSWHGRRVVLVPALNDYALVFGGLPAGLRPESARRELLGDDPACKLAIISGRHGDAIVEFHNANGQHGGAPQTGLATIALAARWVPWLEDCFADGMLSYPTRAGIRRARLPSTTTDTGGRIAVAMPTVSVELKPLIMEQVA
ncbi:hypothetical protein [Emcibacter sp. SYSU 3D8]|uniref:hypothetical protein n=1 Tax=Emcibacter sp. SYSU 3D8 TaxID=3133969 RepID=UPI0031FED0F8